MKIIRFATATVAVMVLLASGVRSVLPASAQAGLALPAGFHGSVLVSGLTNPTAMTIGPDNRLYIAEASGTILQIRNGSGRVIATVPGVALGLAWHARVLYVSYTGSVATLRPSRGYTSFTRRVIISGLPTGKHQNDGMAFADGWLYVGVGSTCNACVEPNPRSGTIMRFRLSGGSGQIYAHGLRNPYGLAFRPGTATLYATDNGRDDFGDQVPDELNVITRGGKYGWPDCWGRGGGTNCAGTIAPVALFEPHASADGIAFYTGKTFPAVYRGDAFVAEFGQTVGGGSNGHKLKRVHFAGNRIIVSDFATGFANPLAVAVARDGSLLVADYTSGLIWKIQANGH